MLENLLSQFNDSDRFFAVNLGRDQNSSSFTIGQVDNAFVNSTDDLAWTPVYPAASSAPLVSASHSALDTDAAYDYWKIPMHSLTINGTSFALSKSRVKGAPSPIAVFDTGTTLVLGPSDDVNRFWASIGGTRKTDDGWQVRCDLGMVVGVMLGTEDDQKEYFIDAADLSWIDGGRDGDWCMGGVQANDAVSIIVNVQHTQSQYSALLTLASFFAPLRCLLATGCLVIRFSVYVSAACLPCRLVTRINMLMLICPSFPERVYRSPCWYCH